MNELYLNVFFNQNYSNKRNTDTLTPFNIHRDLSHIQEDLMLQQFFFSMEPLSFISRILKRKQQWKCNIF